MRRVRSMRGRRMPVPRGRQHWLRQSSGGGLRTLLDFAHCTNATAFPDAADGGVRIHTQPAPILAVQHPGEHTASAGQALSLGRAPGGGLTNARAPLHQKGLRHSANRPNRGIE